MAMNTSTILFALVISSAVTTASAQTGSDDCLVPDVLIGQGLFPYDLTNATTGLEGQGECWSSPAYNDVWFRWTADATGLAVIGNCLPFPNHPTHFTALAAYPDSGCPIDGTSLDCDRSGCSGLGASLNFPVVAGASYILQVGSQFASSIGTSGAIEISIVPPMTNDDCSNPISIAGEGLFQFNQIGATQGAEGQAGSCGTFEDDVWFDWTASVTGTVTISTCGLAGHDTKLAAYPSGGCPTNGSALACNDDSIDCFGYYESSMSFFVTAGMSYLVQLGSSGSGGMGSGNFEVVISPMENDECTNPDVIVGQGSFPYDNTYATRSAEGQSESICYEFYAGAYTTEVHNDLWYSWTPNATGVAEISTCNSGVWQDVKLVLYPGGGCPVLASALACDFNSCTMGARLSYPVVAGATYTLQVGTAPYATGGASRFDISIDGEVVLGTPFCSCEAVGSAPCANYGAPGNGCGNGSSPEGANLTGSGAGTLGSDTVVLSATGLVPGQPGLYFQGLNAIAGGMGTFFGDGLRCAGGGVVRLGVVVADGSGNSDTTGFAQPISILGGVSLGDLRHYQLWYRDPVGTQCGFAFNLTNGFTIQW